MKKATSPALLLLLAIGTFLVAGLIQTASARTMYDPKVYSDDGRFVMSFSPVLGLNVGLVVTIDGQVAGAITKGHVFRQYLAPGRHVIVVAPNGRNNEAWETTIDVRPGDVYSYIAKYNVNEVLLLPSGHFQ